MAERPKDLIERIKRALARPPSPAEDDDAPVREDGAPDQLRRPSQEATAEDEGIGRGISDEYLADDFDPDPEPVTVVEPLRVAEDESEPGGHEVTAVDLIKRRGIAERVSTRGMDVPYDSVDVSTGPHTTRRLDRPVAANDQCMQVAWEMALFTWESPFTADALIGEWYRIYRVNILGFATYLADNPAEAGDLVQAAVELALDKGGQDINYLRPFERLPNMMRAYVRNVAFNTNRKSRRRRELERRYLHEEEDLQRWARNFAMIVAFQQARSRLSALDQAILYGRHVEGLTGSEIARKHRLPLSTAHKRIREAEARLVGILTSPPRRESK